MPTKVKVQAKDVSSAIAQGLKDLGLRRDQVEVTVLEHPKKGFLGFGSKPAVVEIRQKRWSAAELDAQIYMDVPRKKRSGAHGRANNKRRNHEAFNEDRRDNRRRGRKFDRAPRFEAREKAPKANEAQLLPCERIQNAVIPEALKAPMQEAKQYLNDILTHMGVKAENLNVWWDEQQQRILLTFDCDHPAIVIGKEGKTLESIQYLCTLALSRHFDKPISVITDTQNYWRKTEDKINAEIARGVAAVEGGMTVYRFRPMSAQLRRYIHRALEGHATVETASEGEGKWRKVTLRAKKTDGTAQTQTPAAETVAAPTQETVAAPETAAAQDSAAVVEAEQTLGVQNVSAQQQVFAETPCYAQQPVSSQPVVHVECACRTCACDEPAEQMAPAAENAPAETTAEQTAPAQETAQEVAAQPAAQEPAEKANPSCGCCADCGPLFGAVQQGQENK
ncbi:MAG: Jag N-terminal domain-containing protein [Spirochaetota bacterium]|uniref:RNA-binding cell elongation regulator Jag/EloR n=1 Tax=Candidatus Avelusimicrobium faecicola TaxID=3416205 RepID=UPI002A624885|nr:Jag N-terminal domain-containing protein [Spirochaetota bacterium]MDY6129617.1 RNA-binding cell elongation regulator Jag/EloR [Elusimicrobiaceae bacterium]